MSNKQPGMIDNLLVYTKTDVDKALDNYVLTSDLKTNYSDTATTNGVIDAVSSFISGDIVTLKNDLYRQYDWRTDLTTPLSAWVNNQIAESHLKTFKFMGVWPDDMNLAENIRLPETELDTDALSVYSPAVGDVWFVKKNIPEANGYIYEEKICIKAEIPDESTNQHYEWENLGSLTTDQLTGTFYTKTLTDNNIQHQIEHYDEQIAKPYVDGISSVLSSDLRASINETNDNLTALNNELYGQYDWRGNDKLSAWVNNQIADSHLKTFKFMGIWPDDMNLAENTRLPENETDGQILLAYTPAVGDVWFIKKAIPETNGFIYEEKICIKAEETPNNHYEWENLGSLTTDQLAETFYTKTQTEAKIWDFIEHYDGDTAKSYVNEVSGILSGDYHQQVVDLSGELKTDISNAKTYAEEKDGEVITQLQNSISEAVAQLTNDHISTLEDHDAISLKLQSNVDVDTDEHIGLGPGNKGDVRYKDNSGSLDAYVCTQTGDASTAQWKLLGPITGKDLSANFAKKTDMDQAIFKINGIAPSDNPNWNHSIELYARDIHDIDDYLLKSDFDRVSGQLSGRISDVENNYVTTDALTNRLQAYYTAGDVNTQIENAIEHIEGVLVLKDVLENAVPSSIHQYAGDYKRGEVYLIPSQDYGYDEYLVVGTKNTTTGTYDITHLSADFQFIGSVNSVEMNSYLKTNEAISRFAPIAGVYSKDESDNKFLTKDNAQNSYVSNDDLTRDYCPSSYINSNYYAKNEGEILASNLTTIDGRLSLIQDSYRYLSGLIGNDDVAFDSLPQNLSTYVDSALSACMNKNNLYYHNMTLMVKDANSFAMVQHSTGIYAIPAADTLPLGRTIKFILFTEKASPDDGDVEIHIDENQTTVMISFTQPETIIVEFTVVNDGTSQKWLWEKRIIDNTNGGLI